MTSTLESGRKDDDPGRLWVVFPAYNEARVIRDTVGQLRAVCPRVVVVDDGSGDDTAWLASSSGAVVVRHSFNLGQGAALQTGFAYVLRQGADYVATFDADGQHHVDDLLRMLDRLRRGNCDIVLGSRFSGRAEGLPWRRRLLLRAAVVFTRATTSVRLTDVHNGLRVMTATTASRLRLVQDGMAHASELISAVARLQLIAVTARTGAFRDLARKAILVAWAVAAFGLYALVHAEGRYLAPFIVLFWTGILTAIRFPTPAMHGRLATAGAVILVAMIAINIGLFNLAGLQALAPSLAAGPAEAEYERAETTMPAGGGRTEPAVAAALGRRGVRPGDRVAFIGHSFSAFWAHLARVRIVAAVEPQHADRFWAATDSVRDDVEARLRALGVAVIVAAPSQIPAA